MIDYAPFVFIVDSEHRAVLEQAEQVLAVAVLEIGRASCRERV